MRHVASVSSYTAQAERLRLIGAMLQEAAKLLEQAERLALDADLTSASHLGPASCGLFSLAPRCTKAWSDSGVFVITNTSTSTQNPEATSRCS